MPIYEFRCRSCRAGFEAIRPMGDDGASLTCPECGEPAPEKLLSVFAAATSSASASSGSSCAPSGCGGGSGFG